MVIGNNWRKKKQNTAGKNDVCKSTVIYFIRIETETKPRIVTELSKCILINCSYKLFASPFMLVRIKSCFHLLTTFEKERKKNNNHQLLMPFRSHQWQSHNAQQQSIGFWKSGEINIGIKIIMTRHTATRCVVETWKIHYLRHDIRSTADNKTSKSMNEMSAFERICLCVCRQTKASMNSGWAHTKIAQQLYGKWCRPDVCFTSNESERRRKKSTKQHHIFYFELKVFV